MVRTHRLGLLVAVATLLAGCAGAPTSPPGQRDQLAFGIAMAERGLWSEALFRFEQAARANPGDPRILNNLAVAHEALGNFDAALESYRAALALAPGNSDLMANYDRFASFYESFRVREEAELAASPSEPEAGDPTSANGAVPGDRLLAEGEGEDEGSAGAPVERPGGEQGEQGEPPPPEAEEPTGQGPPPTEPERGTEAENEADEEPEGDEADEAEAGEEEGPREPPEEDEQEGDADEQR
jgi:tetratricopeptide (TPR) repeat protein